MSAPDPGCVKTHTSAKCRKNNSPTRHRTPRVQYDLTLRYAIASRSFCARSKGWSFYTAKTQSGHERAAFAAMHGPDLLYSHDPWVWARLFLIRPTLIRVKNYLFPSDHVRALF